MTKLKYASICFLLMSCGKSESKGPTSSKLKSIITVTPATELTLGYGTNADTEDRLGECIDTSQAIYEAADGQPNTIAPDSPSAALALDVKSISSYTDIDTFTDISVSGKIKTASYGGGFSYNNTEIYSLTADSAMVGIRASADYGRWYLKDPKLKPEYQELYKRDPAEFFRVCGTEYVSGYRLGQGVKVLLSTANKSTYSYEKISASANASASFGAGSGSVSASFLNVASSLLKMGSLNVSVRAYGSQGLDTLSGLITAQSDVTKLAEQISQIVGKMKPDHSTRYVFLTSPYPVQSLSFNNSPIMREHRAQTLRSLYDDYRRLSQDLTRANALVTNLPSLLGQWGALCNYATAESGSCENYIAKMNELRTKIQDAIGKLDGLSRECAIAQKIADCRAGDAADVRVNELTIKTWEQQYKKLLREALLIAGTRPH